MIDGIEKLKKIGLNEVSKLTHIEIEHIKWIVDKDFEKLVKYNVKGLIKVIERDCDVDLDAWLNEFLAFKNKLPEDVSSLVSATSIIDSYEDFDEPKSKKGIFFIIFIALIIALFAIWHFRLYDHLNSLFGYLNDKNRSVTYSDTPIVEHAEQKLKSNGIVIDTNSDLTDSNLGKVLAQDSNASSNNATNTTIIMSDINSSSLSVLGDDEKNTTNEPQKTQTVAANKDTEKEPAVIKILPKSRIWIGVIDLKNYKKFNITTDKEFDINASKDQLILTGHGEFKLQDGKKVQDLNSQYPYRFHVKDGKITEINYNEFINLNRGKAW